MGAYNVSAYDPSLNLAAGDYAGAGLIEDDLWSYMMGYPGYHNPAIGYNGADPLPYDPTRPTQDHPVWTCRKFSDAFSMFVHYLSPAGAALTLDANVGFRGDFMQTNEACSYLATQ